MGGQPVASAQVWLLARLPDFVGDCLSRVSTASPTGTTNTFIILGLWLEDGALAGWPISQSAASRAWRSDEMPRRLTLPRARPRSQPRRFSENSEALILTVDTMRCAHPNIDPFDGPWPRVATTCPVRRKTATAFCMSPISPVGLHVGADTGPRARCPSITRRMAAHGGRRSRRASACRFVARGLDAGEQIAPSSA